MEKRTIWMKPSCFTPEIEMIIPFRRTAMRRNILMNSWTQFYVKI